MTKSTQTQESATREENQGFKGFDRLRDRIEEHVEEFRNRPVNPRSAYEFEKGLKAVFDEAARAILEEEFNRLEPAEKKEASPRVRYRGEDYRMNKKTPAKVATIFGTILLRSFYYLCDEPGEPGLHPLHVHLGIVAGSTTIALAERVAGWSVDHSQKEVRRLLVMEHGERWSNDRLRWVQREFRRMAVTFRAEIQTQRLVQWLKDAERSHGRHRPVLSIGRDGIMVPMRGQGYREASTATVAVYDRRGKRLGTVYLGQMPESQQVLLTEELTDLVKTVLSKRTGAMPRLVYVTDKGKAQDTYYKQVLCRMKDPRQPKQKLSWEWVLDFFHVCGYVSQVGEALFGEKRHGWFKRMRQWLREREHGVAQILRSAMQHLHRCTLARTAQQAFWKAYRYLRNHSRWMDYARYRRQGLPIGSGVTEAACKIVFTQRFKRSGMRWHKESGQVILDLRILYLSGIWHDIIDRILASHDLPETTSYQPSTKRTRQKAA